MHVLDNQMSFDLDFGDETLYIRPYQSIQENYKQLLAEHADSKAICKALEGLEFTQSNSKEIKEELARRYGKETDEEIRDTLALMYMCAFGMMEAIELKNKYR